MSDQNARQYINQSVSSLVDGEASELETRRLLNALDVDMEADCSAQDSDHIRATWSRYQLIGAAMRRDVPVNTSIDLSGRIAAAIDAEVLHGTASNELTSGKSGSGKVAATGSIIAGLWRQVGKVAIAASVASVIVFSVQQSQVSPSSDGMVADSNMAAADANASNASFGLDQPMSLPYGALTARTVSAESPVRGSPQVILVPTAQKGGAQTAANPQIKAYLHQRIVEHTQHAALNANHGMIPFARIVKPEQE